MTKQTITANYATRRQENCNLLLSKEGLKLARFSRSFGFRFQVLVRANSLLLHFFAFLIEPLTRSSFTNFLGPVKFSDSEDFFQDSNLRDTLRFGIGLHHAGLNEHDRSTVEKLFVEGKIQILVATSTLAWGVNTPAHLVIIKGTEFFDAPTS